MIHIDSSNFEAEVTDAELPVVIDFWAEWCGPCKMMAPVFEQVAEKYADRAKFVKCNVDAPGNAEITAQFHVRGIPTIVVFFKGCEVLDTHVGAISKAKFEGWLENALTRV